MTQTRLSERLSAGVLSSAWFVLVYNFTNWITSTRHDVPTAAFQWELQIPFIPLMVIPYWSIDLFFVTAFLIADDRGRLFTLTKRIFWAIGIAGVCFLLFPLKLLFVRPEVDGAVSFLFLALDNFHNFYNLAPSLHIALQMILWPVYRRRASGVWILVLNIWFSLIALSTVLVWQHQLIDIFFGLLLGAAVLHFIPDGQGTTREADESLSPEIDRLMQQNADTGIGIRYLALSLLFFFLGYISWLPGFILFWPALSFGLVSAAYLGAGPSVFGDSDTVSSTILFSPYRFCSRLWQSKYHRRIPPVTRISPGLWFGRCCSTAEIEQLKEKGVSSVLYLCVEYPSNWTAPCNFKKLPVLDLTLPSAVQLRQAVNFIDQAQENGAVFVQCALGLGRSALVAAAWLIHSNQARDANEAIDRVKAACADAVLGKREAEVLSRFASSR